VLVTTLHCVPRFLAAAFFEGSILDWTTHDFLFSFLEAPIDGLFLNLCINNSTKLVSVSRNVSREAKLTCQDIPPEKMVVIPNGIDFDKFDNLKRAFGSEAKEEGENILFSGRLTTGKGVFLLVEAVAMLKKHFPNVKLRIVGAGPALNRLRRKVRKLGLSPNVDFLGYLPNLDAMREMLRSSIVALPSSYEGGGPLTILEAMALSKPTVAFSYPFARESIEDFYTGLLARPGDSLDLAEKIRILIDDRNLRYRLGANAFHRVYRENNWENLVDCYVRVYLEATASKI